MTRHAIGVPGETFSYSSSSPGHCLIGILNIRTLIHTPQTRIP